MTEHFDVGLFNRCKRELQQVLGNICITEEGRLLVINHPAVNIALEAVAKLYTQEKEDEHETTELVLPEEVTP